MSAEPDAEVTPSAPPESGLSIPVEAVGDLLAPWRSSALTGSSPHHVTVLYPWLAPPISAEMASGLQGVAAEIEPFDAQLTGVDTFDSGVVYLTPEPAERFAELTTSFCRLFPDCQPYHGLEPVPHLTAARIRGEDSVNPTALEDLADEVRQRVEPMLPFAFTAHGLSLATSDDRGRWSRHSYHPFRSASDGQHA